MVIVSMYHPQNNLKWSNINDLKQMLALSCNLYISVLKCFKQQKLKKLKLLTLARSEARAKSESEGQRRKALEVRGTQEVHGLWMGERVDVRSLIHYQVVSRYSYYHILYTRLLMTFQSCTTSHRNLAWFQSKCQTVSLHISVSILESFALFRWTFS